MLELARLSQTFLIDSLVVTMRSVSSFPTVTIFCLQSKGWPFISAAWAFWDLLLLQGSSNLKQHWFYFTGWKIFLQQNSGAYILQSELYLRLLFVMILSGIIESTKRAYFAIFFSGRMVDMYKPRLEEILEDVILISEIAEFAVEFRDIADMMGIEQSESDEEPQHEENSTVEARRRGRLSIIRWSEVKFNAADDDNDDDSDFEAENETDLHTMYPEGSTDDGSTLNFESISFENERNLNSNRGMKFFTSSTRRIAVKAFLDKWDEPVMKHDKALHASVADTIKFRQAIGYIDNHYTFSEAFGPASTRDEMIVSAESVYKRLMKLSTNSEILSFSVFDILLLEDDGTENKIKKKRLSNVFHPKPNGGIPLLSFVQGCDNIYKKLRMFRASVHNASVIDKVLESLINPVYYCIVAVIMATIMGINIIATLVPLSTLVLGGTFAFGPACAKIFEGIILIVARRPYDIGDRICISNSADSEPQPMTMSWIVEDISITSTTLRFGTSNEIVTIANSSLADARITNCYRSEKATIVIFFNFHISCHVGGKTIQMFREGIEEHIRENPNTWNSLFYLRCESIDSNKELAVYKLSVRHAQTWQVHNRILYDRGELFQYAIALSFKLHINYDVPNERSIMYYGGSLVNGGVQDYKSRVLKNSNINNGGAADIKSLLLTTDRRSTASEESMSVGNVRMNESEVKNKSLNFSSKLKGTNAFSTSINGNLLNETDKTFLSMLQDYH
jgi:hypothetical protein